MYFPDLSEYCYGKNTPRGDARNVGWLSAEHAYAKGDPEPEFTAALRVLAASPVNRNRGEHLCDFCPPPPSEVSHGGLSRMVRPPPGTCGNGEIRVRGEDGVLYIAPVLVLHYVEEHRYAPPEAFVKAVLAWRASGRPPVAVVEIDGGSFAALEEFFDEVSRKFRRDAPWGRNLDAFDDLLDDALGDPDCGLILVWRDSAVSRNRLGYPETIRYLEQKLLRCHAANRDAVRAELDRARLSAGLTLFDRLVGLIMGHNVIELRLE
jgi:RNAse (barnase) inhibitor barstar